MRTTFFFFFLCLLILSIAQNNQDKLLILYDPLTSDTLVENECIKENYFGTFTSNGWISDSSEKGMLKIGIDSTAGGEGILEITLKDLDWDLSSLASGANTKIHFLNMFSNPNGDHHAEQGGTPTDALWTLRSGANKDGDAPRYGDNFKILWSSRGAKRTENNLYRELKKNPPPECRLDKDSEYVFSIQWSKSKQFLLVKVNGELFYDLEWEAQQSELKYIFLGKAADFKSFTNTCFTDLKLYKSTSSMQP